jgi:tRNA pseudouridine38-40 synthase
MCNIKITIAFDGTDFSGWQRQSNAVTIQGELEKALSKICNTPTTLHGAGRTDAGVHALAMVANFETTSTITLPRLQKALNSILPFSIRINEIVEVHAEFHSRFSPSSKTYLYNIDTAAIQSPIDRLYRVHIPRILSTSNMENCLALIVGTHDFASFEASGSRDKSITTGRGSIRTIHRAKLIKNGENTYQFEFFGDGFLRHMVRNIVGTILDVGKGRTTTDEFKEIFAAKDRSVAGVTAPAHGLFLKKIYYK